MTAIDLLRRLVDWDDCQSDNGNTNLSEIVKDASAFLKEYDEAPVVEEKVSFIPPHTPTPHDPRDRWIAYIGVHDDNTYDAIIRIPVPRHLSKPEKIDAEVIE